MSLCICHFRSGLSAPAIKEYCIVLYWNNCFRHIFNCCWRESVKPLFLFQHANDVSDRPNEISFLEEDVR